ncbi:MAG: SDR family NAD(P)-dependent oxidoreductase, partial [Candidatus Hodarchaeota archaeon]
GIAVGGPFEHLSPTSWKRIIDINIWGMINVISATIPKMLEQGFGHVIQVASIAGAVGIGGLVPYSTTKFANSGFCEALYGEYHHRGINVSVVCPFPIKTGLIETVGIGIPPQLLEGFDAETIKEGIQKGKEYYWEKFCSKSHLFNGFCGGWEVDKAVKNYLKQISKKRLYIFESKYGRLVQFIRGASRGIFNRVVGMFGKRHVKLLDETFDIAVSYGKNRSFRKYQE